MCTGWTAGLYYGMNRVAVVGVRKKFPKDIWKPIACKAVWPIAAVKLTRKADPPQAQQQEMG